MGLREARDDKSHRNPLELTAFTKAVTEAYDTRVIDYDGRVGPENIEGGKKGVDLPMLMTEVNQLSQFYINTGAYDHPNGPPAQPPPVLSCGGGNVVESKETNRPLVRDCSVLLDSRDALAGTATSNWSKHLPIGSWTGVAIGGSWSRRVTEVNLASESLNGTIPDGLGKLIGLTTLDLKDNQLTGTIPASLGELSDLSTLRLSGNSLSGCVPPALRSVTTNDLSNTGLDNCDMPTAPPASD